MTPAELRSIDAQVAERVMGWKRQSSNAFKDGEFIIGCGNAVLTTDESGVRIFSPTESDADAMAVIKRCAEKVGPNRSIEVRLIKDIWQASVQCLTAEAKTLPLAISLFALKLWE